MVVFLSFLGLSALAFIILLFIGDKVANWLTKNS
jgi:cell shape-determining protein MreD